MVYSLNKSKEVVQKAWDDENEEWYFSIVDVVAVLTESKNANAYWRKLKQRLIEDGNETVTNCHGLKMKAADGKKRMTDIANTEQLLRIIQSIPSKKAEPFKLWLAQVGRERIEKETGNPVITSHNASNLNSVVTGMIEGVIKAEDDNNK